MDDRIKTILKQGDDLFSKRSSLVSLWQHIAEQFYPARADFTSTQWLGEDFAGNLSTSFPILACQELSNTICTALRPDEVMWGRITTDFDEELDVEEKRWLQWASKLQWNAMYDQQTQFVRAMDETDRDYITFGQGVVSVELDARKNALLYRNWHLRDVAWCERYDGTVGARHRKWKAAVSIFSAVFKGNISQTAKDTLQKDPYAELEVRHAVIPAEEYEKKFKGEWVSIYFEVGTGHILEERGMNSGYYIIPRWKTLGGSQYAYSMATMAALPDARLVQEMTLTLLEAGQNAVKPPLIATKGALDEVNLYSGGISWVSEEYDERTGDSLRPLKLDLNGIPLGFEMLQGTKEQIAKAFFLDRIQLPAPMTKEMTAFEVAQRVQEYVRNNAPLFNPARDDYVGAVYGGTFETLYANNAFGHPDRMPPRLRGAAVKFKFKSPLKDNIERQKGDKFMMAGNIIATAMKLDPSAGGLLNVNVAARDAMDGNEVPAKWLRTKEELAEHTEATQQQQQLQQAAALAQQGGQAAEAVGKGMQAMQGGA